MTWPPSRRCLRTIWRVLHPRYRLKMPFPSISKGPAPKVRFSCVATAGHSCDSEVTFSLTDQSQMKHQKCLPHAGNQPLPDDWTGLVRYSLGDQSPNRSSEFVRNGQQVTTSRWQHHDLLSLQGIDTDRRGGPDAMPALEGMGTLLMKPFVAVPRKCY
jgi:hypothetical protein